MAKLSGKQAIKELKSFPRDRASIKKQQETLKHFADQSLSRVKIDHPSQIKDFKKDMKKIVSRQMWSLEDVQKARYDMKALLKEVRKDVAEEPVLRSGRKARRRVAYGDIEKGNRSGN